ncbi:hypothetical protein K0M31_008656 [Melipona bicolor]|uniref:Uncharacterized protein n=1 Tax=Melipona bicolor TaxID=60889 RepID=A0AA40FQD8_9HYME|nr:hypothetical protein K0M31_008656 [Melipona bicolor]
MKREKTKLLSNLGKAKEKWSQKKPRTVIFKSFRSDNEIILFFASYLRGEVKGEEGEEGETPALLLPGVISRFEIREGQGPK